MVRLTPAHPSGEASQSGDDKVTDHGFVEEHPNDCPKHHDQRISSRLFLNPAFFPVDAGYVCAEDAGHLDDDHHDDKLDLIHAYRNHR